MQRSETEALKTEALEPEALAYPEVLTGTRISVLPKVVNRFL